MATALRKNKQQNFRGKNLQLFQQVSPKMVDYLKNKTAGVEVASVNTRAGVPTLTYRQGNRHVHLHSAYDPVAEAHYWAEQAGQDDWQIGVIFGVGLGYHIEALQRLYPDRSLVLIEPTPDILNATIQLRDLRSVIRHPNFSMVASSDTTASALSLFENHLRSAVIKGRVAFLTWPPYRRLWSDFWQQVQQKVGELTRQISVNFSTYQYFSMQWQENFFTNLRASATDPSAKSLFPHFMGKPAILVAAGPSLQKNIHLLVEAKDKALIVAAGSAVGALLAHGIKPHLVVSFDGGPANYYAFTNIPTDDLVLVYSSVIYPRIVAEYQGPRFVLGVDIYPFERWFHAQIGHDRGSMASGPSIANLTWDLLRQMDCEPIIFVGQDLAFGHDGQTHAAGRVELNYGTDKPVDPEDEAASKAFEWVEDVWGNQVRTKPVWLAMKIWFEQRIYAWGRGKTFIDATEGGAKITGTKIMTLRETLDRYCQTPFDAEKAIRQTYRSQKDQFDSLNMSGKLDTALHHLNQEFDDVLKLCGEAVETLRALDALNRDNALTESEFSKFHLELSRFDSQLAAIDAYTQFVRPAIDNNVAAFDAMSIRLKSETDLGAQGQQLAELYAALFALTKDTATELKSYCQLAVEMAGPYSPPKLVTELDAVSLVCGAMHPYVNRLKELAQMPVESAEWAEVQQMHEELGKLAAQINQTEVLRCFVKELVVLKSTALQELKAIQLAVSTEPDLRRKAEYLANYHALSLSVVEDALMQVRGYSKLPA
ncbi:DUF115 domain-containing protein [bacterium]|nr:DUF115 domain-containing protein [bacterium]